MESDPQYWRHAVAGCTAGLVSVLSLHPLDVIKTRLQVQDGLGGGLPSYRGSVDAVRSMVAQEGWQSLYAGLTPALLGSGVSWSLYFLAYNAAKQRYKRACATQQLPPSLHLLSAAEAGTVVCLMTNPIWVVKTRLQLQRQLASQPLPLIPTSGALPRPPAGAVPAAAGALSARLRTAGAASSSRPYAGVVDAVRWIAREEGLRGFYKGLGPSLLLVSHGAVQFMVYEELKSLTGRVQWGLRGGEQPRQLSPPEISAIGGLSKLAASLLTYPMQVVRARLQQRQDAATRQLRYTNALHVLATTLRREGIPGLYKGLVPSLLRVMPQSAITFMVYESVLSALPQRLCCSPAPQPTHQAQRSQASAAR